MEIYLTSRGLLGTWRLVDIFKYNQNMKRDVYLRPGGVTETRGIPETREYILEPGVYLGTGGVPGTRRIAGTLKYTQNRKRNMYLRPGSITETWRCT